MRGEQLLLPEITPVHYYEYIRTCSTIGGKYFLGRLFLPPSFLSFLTWLAHLLPGTGEQHSSCQGPLRRDQ